MFQLIKNILLLLEAKERKHFYKLILLMLLASLFETVGVASFIPLIDLLTGKSNSLNFFYNNFGSFEFLFNNSIVLIILITLIYLFKNIYLYFFFLFETKFAYKTRFNLGSRLFESYIKKTYYFHVTRNSSTVITKIVQETAIFGGALIGLSAIITETLIVLGIALLLVIIKPLETSIVALIISFASASFYLITRKYSFNVGKSLVKVQKENMKILTESLKSMQEIIMFKAENYFSNIYKNKSIQAAYWGYKISFLGRLPKIFFEITAVLIIFILVLYLNSNNYTILETSSTLGIFLLAAFKIIPSINKILVSMQAIKYSQTAIKSLHKDLKIHRTPYEKINSREKKKNINFHKSIIFRNVTFKFKTSKLETLKNFSMEINNKDFVAIIGKTGTGKTTFLNLLLGLLEPTSGKILVDGKNILKNISAWRSKIGFVSQNTNLLDDTVIKNIAYGVNQEDLSIIDVTKYLKLSQLSEFIKRDNSILNLRIGESGMKISGGQRQRISICRALYKNPEILILDEPTSSLDGFTSKKIYETLVKLNFYKTIIVVSHDISNFKIFNKIFEIKNGLLNQIK